MELKKGDKIRFKHPMPLTTAWGKIDYSQNDHTVYKRQGVGYFLQHGRSLTFFDADWLEDMINRKLATVL